MTSPTRFRVSELPQNAPTTFELRPDPATVQALADELGLSGLRKLSLTGQLAALGKRDWRLTARLGATVVQPCVVTLDPVTTRIDTDLSRSYLAGYSAPEGDEVEMPEDDSVEALPETIDVMAVLTEALALALPEYPRKSDAELGEAVFAAPGTEPMKDADARPFAGLSALRDVLKDKG